MTTATAAATTAAVVVHSKDCESGDECKCEQQQSRNSKSNVFSASIETIPTKTVSLDDSESDSKDKDNDNNAEAEEVDVPSNTPHTNADTLTTTVTTATTNTSTSTNTSTTSATDASNDDTKHENRGNDNEHSNQSENANVVDDNGNAAEKKEVEVEAEAKDAVPEESRFEEEFEEEAPPSFLSNFLSQFRAINCDSNLSAAVCVCVGIVLINVGYFVSVALMLVLLLALALFLVSRWFAATDMSVEITVFLAKFFPPSAQHIWNTRETAELQWTHIFRENYKVIHGELLAFIEQYNYCPEMDDVYPNGAITNWDKKWPTVTLRCYGLDTQMCTYFPKTMGFVNNAPIWLSHVMFSILKPHKYIPRHRGPYRGVFRYQLALEIPPCDDPPKGLYLCVWPNTSSHEFWSPENVPDGEPTVITWTNGEDFIFDDTCVHEVHNSTPYRRIILFMDVERFDVPFLSTIIHKIFMSAARFLPAVKHAGKVQDKYLDECKDEQTKQLRKWEGVVDENRILEQAWMWYSLSPEILPFRKARIAIKRQQQKRQREMQRKLQQQQTFEM